MTRSDPRLFDDDAEPTGHDAPVAEVSFEESLAQLEQTVARLEEGDLGLTESLAAYEAGVRLLRQCHTQLAAAERRIQLLVKLDENGNAVFQPFDDDAELSLEEKQERRARRRSRRPEPEE